MTPLLRAVEALAPHSDPAATDRFGQQALRLAAGSWSDIGGLKMLAILLPRGNVEHACRHGLRALDHAIELGRCPAMIAALAAATDLN